MSNTYNNIELSECGSDIFVDSGNFRTKRIFVQLNGSWQTDQTSCTGKTDVYFDDGVSKIDIVVAFEEGNDNSRSDKGLFSLN